MAAADSKKAGSARTNGGEQDAEAAEPGFRERFELILFLVVEVVCILLFVDFLFIGYYVK